MKSYLIDELSDADLNRVRDFLQEHGVRSSLPEVFWIRIPDDLLTATQSAHGPCHPYAFAVELGRSWVRIELFVRSMQNMRCPCSAYCSPGQRDFAVRFGERLFEELGIRS